MKAIVQSNYGSADVLALTDIDKPVVGENDVLVRVFAASLNAGDVFYMRGDPFSVRLVVGLPKPKNHVLGFDVSGQVEAVGKNVTQFQPGDEVFGSCGRACAEYVCAAEEKFVLKPVNLTHEQAAAVPTAAATALNGIRDAGKVRPGQKVLINGASGGVGTFAVQIAKSLGAEVTGVCSTSNVELVRSIGADHVIDYTQEDFTQGGQLYDLILDNVANHPLSECRRALKPDGTLIPNSGGAGLGYVVKAFASSIFIRQQGRPYVASTKPQDLVDLKELIESGQVTPVIDKSYPLGETPEAMGYLADGHARGKVVIDVEQP